MGVWVVDLIEGDGFVVVLRWPGGWQVYIDVVVVNTSGVPYKLFLDVD